MDAAEFKKLYREFLDDEDVQAIRPPEPNQEPNLFRILKASHYEIRHSNFLAWLLDPNENHGLGDSVLKRFLSKVIPTENITFGKVRVATEWVYLSKRIDILIQLKSHVICIENKRLEGIHSKQLAEYEAIVENQFKEFKKVYIYLTPDGTHTDSMYEHNFQRMSYRDDVIEVLENIDYPPKNPFSSLTKNFVRQYLVALREDVLKEVRDPRLAKVYSQHKDFFDYIYRVKDKNISESILRHLESLNYFAFISSRNAKNLTTIRFYPREIEKHIYFAGNNPKKQALTFELQRYEDRIEIFLSVLHKNTKNYDWRRLYEILCEQYPDNPDVEKIKKLDRIHFEPKHIRQLEADEDIIEQVTQKVLPEYQAEIDAVIRHLEKHSTELSEMKLRATGT